MKLNADLGESFGQWQHTADEAIMPLIDQANIACGYHAGDALSMQTAVVLAKKHGVSIGAHPSYPDLQGFGRRSMRIAEAELIAMIHAQIASLDGVARTQGKTLEYVKPHGALYNDMMRDENLLRVVMQAVSAYYQNLPLMLMSTPHSQHQLLANEYGLDLIFEAFADRAYDDQGHLVARSQPNAVLDKDAALRQVKMMLEQGLVVSQSGKTLSMRADTLCVHGDNPEAIALVHAIRSLLDQT